MNNKTITSLLKSTATLLVLHGANPFQASHYNQAALLLEKTQHDLAHLSLQALKTLPGLPKSLATLIHEINTTGTLQRWEELMAKTPQGVLDILELKGMGPKKVRALWKQLGIENPAALAQACTAGKVAQLPGFGQKTQASIQENLAWKHQQQGKFHYATALPYATTLVAHLQQAFPALQISLVGTIRRKMETIEQVEILNRNHQYSHSSQLATELARYRTISTNPRIHSLAWQILRKRPQPHHTLLPTRALPHPPDFADRIYRTPSPTSKNNTKPRSIHYQNPNPRQRSSRLSASWPTLHTP